MKHLWLKAFVMICLFAPAAQAGVNSGEKTMASIMPMTSTQVDAPTLADRIDSIIVMRTAMVDRVAPEPQDDCKDPSAVARRVVALKELDSFARMTINGLIDAAPSTELKAETSEELTPVMMRHREDMTIALSNLLELPLVREKSTPAAKAVAEEVVRLADQTARP